jgi:hypothetical protein
MPKWFRLDPIPCRVCGLEFTPSRRDAVTCTSTCRKRLQRGHALDYVESKAEREYQDALEHKRQAYAHHSAAIRRARLARRALRNAKRNAEITIQAVADYLLGQAHAEQEARNERAQQKWRGTVAGAVKLLASRGEPYDAATITKMLNMPKKLADTETALQWLKAEGHLESILSEAAGITQTAQPE